MATVCKAITPTDQQDDWIKSQVQGGDYTNDREYIRDLIRRQQERGAEIEVVRAACTAGTLLRGYTFCRRDICAKAVQQGALTCQAPVRRKRSPRSMLGFSLRTLVRR